MLRLLALCLGCHLGGAPSGPPLPPLSLDGAWRSEGALLALPLTSERAPFTVERTLRLPGDWRRNQPALLRLDTAGWRVTAWVNGELADSATGGLLPMTLSLGSGLRAGENSLQLRFDPPSSDNVLEGVDARPLAQWTGNTPKPGRVMAQGGITIEFPREVSVGALSVALDGGRLTATATGSAPDGTPVGFEVVRDGEVLASLPDAAMMGGVASSSLPWSGARWSLGEPSLQLLVARLEGGQGRQLRFGARDLERAGGKLLINEREQYIAALRYESNEAASRGKIFRQLSVMVQSGANAVEIHGAAPDLLLQVADELGLMVVETPRCDGQIRVDGPLQVSEQWTEYVAAAARRTVAVRERHPSLVLRTLEGPFKEPLLDAAYYDGAVPTLSGAGDIGGLVEGEVEQAVAAGMPPYLHELPWPLDAAHRDIAGRLEPLLVAHRTSGLGLVLPQVHNMGLKRHLSASALAAERAALASMLARHDVTVARIEGREGPATVEVTALRGGAPAVGVPLMLRVPAQLASGAFTDEQGKATIIVDYAGEATLSALDASDGVNLTLRRGIYSERRWKAYTSKVTLELSDAP